MLIHDIEVRGAVVDAATRCAHYRSPRDIIAIRFKCCGEWYPCFECHKEAAGHAPEVWPRAEFSEPAILCGACGRRLAIDEYMACGAVCPACASAFNPGCANHYHLYFETEAAPL